MAKNKKPKFLEKETPELLDLLKTVLSENEEDIDGRKALKITEELISRLPTDEGPVSVDEALQSAADMMTEALNRVKAAYNNEVAMMEDSDEDPDEEEEEAPAKPSKKKGGSKKTKEEPEEEEDSDEEKEDSDEEDSDEDYTDWSTKDLKKECRTRGIKVTKGMGKAEMVKALEADDQE